MPTGHSRSPKLLKRVLIKLSEGFNNPVPNMILFQYNLETMNRDLTLSSVSGKERGE